MFGGVQHGGQQVGQAFADAGAAFHHQRAPLVDGAGYRRQHFRLLGARFKAGERLGENAVRRQQFLNLAFRQIAAQGVGRHPPGFPGAGRGPFRQAPQIQPIHPHRADAGRC